MGKFNKFLTIISLFLISACSYAQATQPTIVNWAVDATIATFTYNAKNVEQRLPVMQQYFTAQGWTDYMNALNKSGNIETVKTDNLAVSATTMGNPKTTKHTIVDGVDEWIVELPILVTYAHANASKEAHYWIYLNIVKNNADNARYPYAIKQLIAKPREN